MKTLVLLSILFCIPVSLFKQVDNPLEERKATQKDIKGSSETIHLQDTIRDTTHQVCVPKKSPDTIPSIIYNMPIYVPDSSMQYFEKKHYEDLISQHPHWEIFFLVDTMPEFPGGKTALKKYIAEHIKYPSDAHDNGIEGTVYVQLLIDKSGSVRDPKIIKPVFPSLDKEAIRVVQSFPRWEPGKQNGAKVNVQLFLPIKFKLPHLIK
jgi:TonB family protein